ncbi:DUF805 domain-containing protein [Asticcacaulis sp. ZE23SCel15]|uniref:DUF805 domain-containing protein n=1 Tax=Asticcacaulis sp. ZE23SCel15 TaxID=3059027 RepID=UPI00265DD084|nr:DUF805 domain-containing protein [Asticcacaulis sp. ZE23SCel15]WKL57084.1 DUF805 domain-containing protein [Asticcacaulis sp. ZE23SCel15]
MNAKIDWSELFFSSTGRGRQMPFVIAGVILLIALAFYESVVTGGLKLLTGWVVYPVLFFCAACVLSKRLHDRGRSGWWSAVILVAFVMVWPQPEGFFDFIGVAVLVWAFVDLTLMPGERGMNRYGPPIRVTTEEPVV